MCPLCLTLLHSQRWSAANTGLSMPFGRCVNCYTYLSPDLTDELINTVRAGIGLGLAPNQGKPEPGTS